MGCKVSTANVTGPAVSGTLAEPTMGSLSCPAEAVENPETSNLADREKILESPICQFSPSPGLKWYIGRLSTDNHKWAVKYGRNRVQRPKAARGSRTRHNDPVVEICIPGSTVDIEDPSLSSGVPVSVKAASSMKQHNRKFTPETYSHVFKRPVTQNISGSSTNNVFTEKAYGKTERRKSKIAYFEVSQEREICYTPVQELLPEPAHQRHWRVSNDPDITRIVHKRKSPDMNLESEGLLPGSVIEMPSTRRKREESEALRAWMERMEARERAIQ